MKRKSKPFPLTGYIIAALKKIWKWDPERKKALNRVMLFNGNYNCEECGGRFERKGVQVDHTNPVVVPGEGIKSWDKYISRLFVKSKLLQVLCKPCHKKKSNKENAERRKK